jgi:hypothetical protein
VGQAWALSARSVFEKRTRKKKEEEEEEEKNEGFPW